MSITKSAFLYFWVGDRKCRLRGSNEFCQSDFVNFLQIAAL